jgi:hypothetical protein
MKKKKVHFRLDKRFFEMACDTKLKTDYSKKFVTDNIDFVTCESCKKTKAYIKTKAELESKRPLEDGEFVEPKKENIKISPETTYREESIFTEKYDSVGQWKYEKYLDWCVDNDCGCEVTDRDYVIITFYSDKNASDFRIFNNELKKPKKQPSNLAFDLIDDARKRTQLQKDREEYNLNDEQVEYLSGFDYEIVSEEEEESVCEDCVFRGRPELCRPHNPAHNVRCNTHGIIFKQIHKKQESFNKSLESESVEEPFENVADVVDEVLEGSQNNHDSHYKKPSGELEQIDKMELIICHGLPKEYHQLLIDNLNLALGSKYIDRLGKKDDTDKEIDKMKNYNHRSVTREWRK